MSAAVINSEQPIGGSPLSAESRLTVLDVTLAAGSNQTSFTVTHGCITTTAKIMIQPMESTAAELGQTVPSRAAGVLTVSHAIASPAGTENFHIWCLSST
jgi:hypothetical protein